jgi:hypothetical protein
MAAAAPAEDPAKYGPREGFLAPCPRVTRGEPTVLDVSPDGNYLAYCNATNVIVRELSVRAAHSHPGLTGRASASGGGGPVSLRASAARTSAAAGVGRPRT